MGSASGESFVVLNFTDNGRKRSILLHLAGEAVFDIFDGLIVSPTAGEADRSRQRIHDDKAFSGLSLQSQAESVVRGLYVTTCQAERPRVDERVAGTSKSAGEIFANYPTWTGS